MRNLWNNDSRGFYDNGYNEAIEAQANYCNENNIPNFTPHNGICYRCHKQIYEIISEEKASKELITGCPHCNYSFCD